MMGPVVYSVDKDTNIHVEPTPDKLHVGLTTIVEGKATVTIVYTADELLMFNWLLLHSLSKIM